LISTGTETRPSLLGDASESGNDVFIFTFGHLVGQDEDELRDVYDARVGGGLPSQSPTKPPSCESAEGCHGPAQQLPAEATPATPTFQGPPSPKPKRKKAKAHKKQGHKKKHHRKAHSSRGAVK
jgi:hypothetical protein